MFNFGLIPNPKYLYFLFKIRVGRVTPSNTFIFRPYHHLRWVWDGFDNQYCILLLKVYYHICMQVLACKRCNTSEFSFYFLETKTCSFEYREDQNSFSNIRASLCPIINLPNGIHGIFFILTLEQIIVIYYCIYNKHIPNIPRKNTTDLLKMR